MGPEKCSVYLKLCGFSSSFQNCLVLPFTMVNTFLKRHLNLSLLTKSLFFYSYILNGKAQLKQIYGVGVLVWLTTVVITDFALINFM